MRVNISISPELHKRTKTWLDGRPLSPFIADLIIGYLDMNKSKTAPKNFKYKEPVGD